MDTSTLPTFLIMFLSVYLLGYLVIFRKWVPNQRTEASSCFMSLAHGTPATIMAIHALLHTGFPPRTSFASPNSHLHNTVLDFSIAYFLTDLLHYFLFFPRDTLFILHHLATLYVLSTCRFIVRHGAHGMLMLLILAEATSFCQNVWSIARLRKVEAPAAAWLYAILTPPFYGVYSVARGMIGPILVMKMWMFYLSGGSNGLIPGWAWISWLLVISTAILISISWVSNHWLQWYRETSEAYKKPR